MREIKFRAWDKVRKAMVEVTVLEWMMAKGFMPELIYIRGEGDRTHQANGSDVDRLVLSQFTGLKDKNGKEIYEGDVVRGGWDVTLRPMFVCWQAPSFVMKTGLKSKTWSTFDIAPDDNQLYEIIGNIYENPESLSPSSE